MPVVCVYQLQPGLLSQDVADTHTYQNKTQKTQLSSQLTIRCLWYRQYENITYQHTVAVTREFCSSTTKLSAVTIGYRYTSQMEYGCLGDVCSVQLYKVRKLHA